jgi:hypothetical protein
MRSNTSKIALCGVVAALSVVVLFLTGIVPVATVALPALAGCFIIAVVAETDVKHGFVVYGVVSVLSVFLVPDREAALMYLVFFGYYPALYGILSRIRSRFWCWTAKLAVFNAAMVVETVAALWVLGIPVEEMLPYGWVTVPVFAILLNVIFVLYDLSMNGLIVLYIRRVHPAIGKYLK